MVELAGYRARANALLTTDEQAAVVDLIAFDPTCGDLIPGTGGLRKLRVGRSGIGKRGGARVVYFFHDPQVPIFLLALYAKNEKADLSASERREFAGLTKELIRRWTRA
ncbi:type II toxin-antitoxin system RelE/ParE family toxin [Rhodoplanes roseus]|uniref:type II toxin-antitoxin system RelE/ParE family toxin n=1 Tax=Rhodoplanes roseus TaxID=29409 RepID=UPI001FE08EA1|nr:type II toxin-antitoxin system RelE/ParE family toxin [Rhodoplanes roseus]